jgi:hypothetical protein
MRGAPLRQVRHVNAPCSHLLEIRDVVPSAQGCEDWLWCYVDEVMMEPA